MILGDKPLLFQGGSVTVFSVISLCSMNLCHATLYKFNIVQHQHQQQSSTNSGHRHSSTSTTKFNIDIVQHR
jgi:hypothetical protein